MTGIEPQRNRFIDYYSRADEDVPNVMTLPQHLKSTWHSDPDTR